MTALAVILLGLAPQGAKPQAPKTPAPKTAAAKPVPAAVADVLKTPAKYDGKPLAVKGKVDRFQARQSKKGRDYYTFSLVDGGKSLAVYGGDKLAKPPKNGDAVTVVGKFAGERTVGGRIFHNEIDASKKLDKAFGLKR